MSPRALQGMIEEFVTETGPITENGKRNWRRRSPNGVSNFTDASQGVLLALASILAGNLLIVGGIANIIVVDAATRRCG